MQQILENAGLDENIPAAGNALIVDVEGTTLVRQRTLIDDRDFTTRNRRPKRIAVGALATNHQVRLERMADRFMQQHTTGSGCKDHRHFTTWRAPRIEQHARSVHHVTNQTIETRFFVVQRARSGRDCCEPGMRHSVAAHLDLHTEPAHRPAVETERSCQRRDRNPFVRICPRHGYAADGLITPAHGCVDIFRDGYFVVEFDGAPRHRDFVGAVVLLLIQCDRCSIFGCAACRTARGSQQSIGTEIIGQRVATRIAPPNAQPCTPSDFRAPSNQLTMLNSQRARDALLNVDLSEVAPVRAQNGHRAREDVTIEPEPTPYRVHRRRFGNDLRVRRATR